MAQMCAPSQVFSVLAVISVIIYLINMFTSANIRTVDVTDLKCGVYFIEIDGYLPKSIKFSKL